MKTIIQILIIICFINSNSTQNYKKELLGDWVLTNSANVQELKFYKDSLTYSIFGHTSKYSWVIFNKGKIYCSLTKDLNTEMDKFNPKLDSDFIIEYTLYPEKNILSTETIDGDYTLDYIKVKERLD